MERLFYVKTLKKSWQVRTVHGDSFYAGATSRALAEHLCNALNEYHNIPEPMRHFKDFQIQS